MKVIVLDKDGQHLEKEVVPPTPPTIDPEVAKILQRTTTNPMSDLPLPKVEFPE